MKTTILVLATIMSLSAFSAEYNVKKELKKVRSLIVQDKINKALDTLEEVIDAVEESKIFSDQYQTTMNSSRFRCSSASKTKVMRRASESAQISCYEEGYTTCKVIKSMIIKEGAIKVSQGAASWYEYGCLSKALVRGTR